MDMYTNDSPIAGRSGDLLNRSEFSVRFAAALQHVDASGGFTVALNGRWGCGKTSILNMVREEIDRLNLSLPEAERMLCADFNPWFFSSQEQLIQQFLATLAQAIDGGSQANEALGKVGGQFKAYAEAIEPFSLIPGAAPLVKVLQSIMKATGVGLEQKAEDGKETVLQQREKLIQMLRAQRQHIILFIDDIDRMNAENISLLFQLIGAAAKFPNVIYVLSFDKDIVSRALKEVHHRDGILYLEKIIQMSVNVPSVPASQYHELLMERLEGVLGELPTKPDDPRLMEIVVPFLHDLRDINRLMNTFSFAYAAVKDEVDALDLLSVLTFAVFVPDLYEWMEASRDYLLGRERDWGFVKKEKNDYRAELKQRLKSALVRREGLPDEQRLENMLFLLFPALSQKIQGYSNGTEKEIKLQKRISDPTRFAYYFTFFLPESLISADRVKSFVYRAPRAEMLAIARAAVGKGALHQLTEEVNCRIGDLSTDRLELLTLVLGEFAIDFSHNENGQTGVIDWMCTNTVFGCFEALRSPEKRYQLLKDAIPRADSAGIGMCAVLINQSNSREWQRTPEEYPLLTDEQTVELSKRIADIYNRREEKNALLNRPDFLYLAHALKIGCPEEWEALISHYLKIPEMLAVFIRNFTMQFPRQERFHFNGEALASLCSIQSVMERIAAFPKEDFVRLSPQDRSLLTQFYLACKQENPQYPPFPFAEE